MIIGSLLLLANLGLVGLSFSRLNLHIKLNRATRRRDLHEALRLLRKLQKLPATPLGNSICDALLLRVATGLRDWDLVEETWERFSKRPRALQQYYREGCGYYALSLAERGRYRESLELFEDALDSSISVVFVLSKASVLTRCGRFAEARQTLTKYHELPASNPFHMWSRLLLANLDYLEGAQDSAQATLSKLSTDPHSLRHFKEEFLLYGLVRALCRSGLYERARPFFPQQPSDLSTPRCRELRMLAAAFLAEGEGKAETALSYYTDLKSLAAVDAEAYVRASNLCLRLEQPEQAQEFLEAALHYDPESHWATVAKRKLRKLEAGPS